MAPRGGDREIGLSPPALAALELQLGYIPAVSIAAGDPA
jgi:hypothetical protein